MPDTDTLLAEIARLESIINKHQWNYLTAIGASIGRPLPEHGSDVLFQCGGAYYAGVFLNDMQPSTNPEGDLYEGDFGFFDHDCEYYEVENVKKWVYIL